MEGGGNFFKKFWSKFPLTLLYLIICGLSLIFFFSGACYMFLLFYGGMCLMPLSAPWQLYLSLILGEEAFVASLILSFLINLLMFFGVESLSNKFIESKNKAKIISTLVIIIYVIIAIFLTQSFIGSGISCAKHSSPDGCYWSTAIENEDISICDKITDSRSMGSCYGNIIKETHDYEQCDLLISQISKDTCYLFMANSKEWCDKIVEIESKNECHARVIPLSLNSNDCDILEGEHLALCYYRIGTLTGNGSLCEKISNLSEESIRLRGDCFIRVATKNSDFSLCNEAGSEKDQCYYTIAMNTGNPDLCDLLSSSGSKDKCLSVLAERIGTE